MRPLICVSSFHSETHIRVSSKNSYSYHYHHNQSLNTCQLGIFLMSWRAFLRGTCRGKKVSDLRRTSVVYVACRTSCVFAWRYAMSPKNTPHHQQVMTHAYIRRRQPPPLGNLATHAVRCTRQRVQRTKRIVRILERPHRPPPSTIRRTKYRMRWNEHHVFRHDFRRLANGVRIMRAPLRGDPCPDP